MSRTSAVSAPFGVLAMSKLAKVSSENLVPGMAREGHEGFETSSHRSFTDEEYLGVNDENIEDARMVAL